MRLYHGANFYLAVLSILARVLSKVIEYFLLDFNITCCCISPFLPVRDLEKRKDPKPRVKVDKGNGNKPSVPEGQFKKIFFDLLILEVELF